MNILITGASGFIGSRTAARLLLRGHDVRATGRGAGTPRRLADLGVRYSALDYLDAAACQRACADIDALVHCAGKGGTWGSPDAFHAANVAATTALLRGARQAGVKRFVNLSSASIQFDFRHQFDLPEAYLPPKFSNAYAETKHLGERAVAAAHAPDFLTVSLRPRGVVGEGDAIWLPTFVELRRRDALKQVGDGTNVTNFTSVSNVVDAIELCLDAPADAMGQVYNIHNGAAERLWDVVERGLAYCGLNGKRTKVPLHVAMSMARLSEAWHRLARSRREPTLLPVKVAVSAYSFTLDLSRSRSGLGYSPRQSTDDALHEFADWIRQPAPL